MAGFSRCARSYANSSGQLALHLPVRKQRYMQGKRWTGLEEPGAIYVASVWTDTSSPLTISEAEYDNRQTGKNKRWSDVPHTLDFAIILFIYRNFLSVNVCKPKWRKCDPSLLRQAAAVSSVRTFSTCKPYPKYTMVEQVCSVNNLNVMSVYYVLHFRWPKWTIVPS